MVKWGGKIDKVTFWGAKKKVKIFSTTTMNALTSKKKKKKKFVFVDRLLHFNIFRNIDFVYL